MKNSQYRIPFKKQNLKGLDEALERIKSSSLSWKDQIKQVVENQIKSLSKKGGKQHMQKIQSNLSGLYQYIKTQILDVEFEKGINKESKQLIHYYFSKEGKKVRPLMIYLLNESIKAQNQSVKKWSSLIQIMHIASLIHDDIIDNSSSRRGQQTQHIKFGKKKAVFSGDYIISKASKAIYDFNKPQLYRIYSIAMDDLVEGEMIQMLTKKQNIQLSKKQNIIALLEKYMDKSYYKTAALMANGLRAIPHLSSNPKIDKEQQRQLQQISFRIGQHYGIAFQLIDDILDYISTFQEMGKQAMADLQQGNVTGPVYFSFYKNIIANSSKSNQIQSIISKKLKTKQELQNVKNWVLQSGGIQITSYLAMLHIKYGLEQLEKLSPSREIFETWKYLGAKVLARRK